MDDQTEQDDTAAAGAPAWPERIVVGVDESEQARWALDRALELAQRAASSVVIVHAVGLLEDAALRPRVDLDALRQRALARTGCVPELVAPPVAEPGAPAEVILRVAERLGGDLVVVGRRGAGGTVRPLGSTSEVVIEHAHAPVLVVARPEER